MTNCFPRPDRVKNENDATKVLAALEFVGSTTQFEAAVAFGVNQKRLSEVLHRKKYLGGKQKPPTGKGTQSDPLQLGSKKEEAETQEEKWATKCKPDDDDNEDEDDDFETLGQKDFSMKPVVKKPKRK